MRFFESLSGMIEISLTSADPAAALDAISKGGISIFNAQIQSDIVLDCVIFRKDLPSLRNLAEKRGEQLTVRQRRGLFWSGKKLLARPVLLTGLISVILMALYFPGKIYFISVEGNEQVPSRQILAAGEECGIRFGASREQVRSEKTKNALLTAIPELQWAGVNTRGCVATISVREKNQHPTDSDLPDVSNIIASRDGVITICTVEQGNALCQVGQAVCRGQPLVSGYTNSGLTVRASRSVAEIYAETEHDLKAVTPAEFTVRGQITDIKKKFALMIGKKRINLYEDSGIPGTSCGKIRHIRYLTLPGGFQLPLAIMVEREIYYLQTAQPLQTDPAKQLLMEFSEQYLTDQMIAGKILKKYEQFRQAETLYSLEGQYACSEMIGREQVGEILH